MAEYLNKVSIQTPTKKMRDFDLSCQHVTTQTFMRPAVVYAKEFIGVKSGTKIKLNLKTYSRMEPMLKPTLGSMQIRNRVFYVPFRQVWQSFDNMLTQSPIANPEGGSLILGGVPYFTLGNLEIVLGDPNNGFAVLAAAGQTRDFISYSGDDMVYTPNGRQAVKLLNALGYQLPYDMSNKGFGNYIYSFLPLLCAAKVFIDWYFPAQYAHTGEFINIDGIMQRVTQYQASQLDLWSCLNVLQYVFYDNDYCTAQWDTPVAPAVGTFDSINIPDITVDRSLTHSTVYNGDTIYGTPAVFGTVAGDDSPVTATPLRFSQYIDTALKLVTNEQKRHQLVGARVIDRMLADYGLVTPYEQMKRSYYLGSQVFPVQISDVMSNSDTLIASDSSKGEVLGQYAGKGLAFDGNGNFEFEVKEFGMCLVFNSVVPDVGYFYQVDRQVLHKTRLDFYNSLYDGLGVQAISKAEVRATDTPTEWNEVFGFLPMYSDYKSGFDRLTGNFVIPSKLQGLAPWMTMRSLLPLITQNSGVLPAHSIEFMRGSDAYQFCRLFYGYTGEEFDVFYMVHRINIKVTMAASPMYDTYQFDEPEGDMITMQANGATLN